ncbi:MAG: hypothetical protein OEY89_06780, partial [Gammaproteobacteria bacterium]|nr:hypothetical protein [Gammaproteobacteria bacterium]
FNTAPTGPDMAWYMCADPVYIQADRDDAVLLAHEELHLSTEEAQFIAADINHFYKNEPWELVVLSTRHWVIKSDIQYDLQLTSLQTVSGQRVRENLPQGKDAKYWRQVLNEIQMLLHGMPLHQQRELEGKLPVNSLWFWGAGSLPELNVFSPGKWQMVFGKDRLCEAISKYTNCPYNNIDNQVFNSDNMGFVKTKGDCLFLDQGFSSTVHTQEEFQKQLNMLLTFDAQWIKPAITLLKQGKLDSLRLLTGRGKSFHLRKENCNRKKWGWWYSNKLFQQFVE